MAKLIYESDSGEKLTIEFSDQLVLDSLTASSGKINMLHEMFLALEVQARQYLQDLHGTADSARGHDP